MLEHSVNGERGLFLRPTESGERREDAVAHGLWCAAAAAGRRDQDLAGKRERDEFCGLRANPAHRTKYRIVIIGNGAGDIARCQRREHAERRPRPNTGHTDEQFEQVLLVGAGKTVERERVFANDLNGVQGTHGIDRHREGVCRCDVDEITDSADLDHRGGARGTTYLAGQGDNHVPSVRPPRLLDSAARQAFCAGVSVPLWVDAAGPRHA